MVMRLWELPLKGEKQEPQTRLPSTEHHRVFSAGERQDMLGESHYFFLILKGARAQVLCFQPLTFGRGEGREVKTGVHEESLEREALGDMEEMPWGFLCWYIPEFCSTYLS